MALRHLSDISGTWAQQSSATLLFARMSRPASSSCNRKYRRESLAGDLQSIEQSCGEEFDIGVERMVRFFPPECFARIGLHFGSEGQIGRIGSELSDGAFQDV